MQSSHSLGPVMFDLRGGTITAEEKEQLAHPAAGGVILFGRNYESTEQISALVASARAVRPEILIAVDHEGGRVQRFREGFTRLPPASRYADACGNDRPTLLELLETAGWLMAAELRAVDVDFSFAPVLDVDCGISEIIGDRSFSRNAENAGTFALAFARGMRQAGMAAVGKHFPGHGGVALDSHLTLPEDPRSFEEIAGKDLLPFTILIESGLEGIMPAHVVYTAVDPQPAGFSRHWIEDILRGRLGFDGAVFSDDLSMEGAAMAGGYEERAHLALEAGCDMVLMCNRPEAIGLVLETLEKADWTSRQPRLARMQGRFPIHRGTLLSSPEWRSASERIGQLQQT